MAHDNNIAESVQKPAQVRIAILLLYAYSVISLLVDLILTTINGRFSISLVVHQAIIFLISIFFVFTISKGETWPRNFLLLFFIWGIFSSLFYLFIISVMTYSFGLIPIILLYLKPAKLWFGQFVAENNKTERIVMTTRRVFLRAFSFLAGGLSIYFIIEKFVYQREEQPTIGYYWFLPSILILLWLGIYLGSFPGLLIALFVGWNLVNSFGGLMLPGTYGDYLVITPAAPTIFGGLVGSILGSQINKNKPTWEIGLALVGLILGFGVGFLLFTATVG